MEPVLNALISKHCFIDYKLNKGLATSQNSSYGIRRTGVYYDIESSVPNDDVLGERSGASSTSEIPGSASRS